MGKDSAVLQGRGRLPVPYVLLLVLKVVVSMTPSELGKALINSGFEASEVSLRLLGSQEYIAPSALVRRDASRLKAPVPRDSIDALISLFVLGTRLRGLESHRLLPVELLQGLECHGLLRRDGTHCSEAALALSPIRIENKTLLLTTDFPYSRGPANSEPAMYLGPDSIALLDAASFFGPKNHVLDLCAGSGVQGLAALARGTAHRVTAVEREARAVQLARFNAELNADVLPYSIQKTSNPDHNDTNQFDLILANPPYVAVPNDIKYECFAAGGPTGERVVLDCIRAAALAAAADGMLMLVCEVNGEPSAFVQRAVTEWYDASGLWPRLALLVDDNDQRAKADSVAKRRAANDPKLQDLWLNHLRTQNIDTVRNGILFICSANSPTSPAARFIEKQELILFVSRLWAPPPRNLETRRAVALALSYLGRDSKGYSLTEIGKVAATYE